MIVISGTGSEKLSNGNAALTEKCGIVLKKKWKYILANLLHAWSGAAAVFYHLCTQELNDHELHAAPNLEVLGIVFAPSDIMKGRYEYVLQWL